MKVIPLWHIGITLVGFLLPLNETTAHPGHEELAKLKPRALTRVVTFPERGEWQTAVSVLRDGDLIVTIIGITHIAESGYRALVMESAGDPEVILFESLGFQTKEKGVESPTLAQLAQGYQQHAEAQGWKVTLPLAFPEGLKPLPVDVDQVQFTKLTPEQQKSVLKDLPEGGFSMNDVAGKESAPFSGQSDLGKIREDLLVRALHLQFIKGRKNCAVIVSAARMPALELRLRKQKFVIKETRWLRAWSWPTN